MTANRVLQPDVGAVAAPARRRILVVDDHELVRYALKALIEQETDLVVGGEASDERGALEQLSSAPFDVAVIDLTLGSEHGLELIKKIKAKYPSVRIVVLSMHDERVYAERVLRAGSSGYVNKQQPSNLIIDAIRTVLSGNVYVSHQMAHSLLSRVVGNSAQARTRTTVDALSDRELQVLHLLGEGLATTQIAKQLHLSSSTIDTYRERIKDKLNIPNASELVRFAVLWRSEEK